LYRLWRLYPACTSDSIHAIDDVPEDKKDFVEKNAAFYKH
jgi:hypothetical protein